LAAFKIIKGEYSLAYEVVNLACKLCVRKTDVLFTFHSFSMSGKPTVFPLQHQGAGAGKPGLEYKITPSRSTSAKARRGMISSGIK
jgi:hypothetical protein